MSNQSFTPLTDLDLMPFGKYKNECMSDVPASYLHWLWTEADYKDKPNTPVGDYIKRNLSALKMEYRDGLWS